MDRQLADEFSKLVVSSNEREGRERGSWLTNSVNLSSAVMRGREEREAAVLEVPHLLATQAEQLQP